MKENFNFGLTDPLFNAICVNAQGSPLTLPAVTNPAACAALGFQANPDVSLGLVPFDLTRGGKPFSFFGTANINQQAAYAQDQITWRNWAVNLGVRFDHYDGITHDNLFQPRAAVSYLIKPTNTLLKLSYTRSLETPYNENLVLSSSTGSGGLAQNTFGANAAPLRPGHRDDYSAGIQQALSRFLQVDANYFWKYTRNAYDFDTLFNTPITFPISWRKSKIDGIAIRLSTPNFHGFQAYATIGHTRARFFGPETGGLLFNSSISSEVFRIDHDQALEQTTYLRYQYKKNGPWAAFTWRYDSGAVAGAVATLDDVLVLTAAQQTTIGFFCGTQRATVYDPITSCNGSNYGATRVKIPSPGNGRSGSQPAPHCTAKSFRCRRGHGRPVSPREIADDAEAGGTQHHERSRALQFPVNLQRHALGSTAHLSGDHRFRVLRTAAVTVIAHDFLTGQLGLRAPSAA